MLVELLRVQKDIERKRDRGDRGPDREPQRHLGVEKETVTQLFQ